MSTTASLLLSLLCLGAVGAQVASDRSEFHAKSFINILTNAIEHKETKFLDAMVSDDFLFIGCTKNVDKKQLLGMLGMIPADAKPTFVFQSSHYIGEKRIEYTVAINGMGINLNANFVIAGVNDKWVLIKGNVPNCPKSRHLAANAPDAIAKEFLALFQADIASGDAAKIASRFSDNFLFHGCKGDYNKQKVLGLLGSIPKDSKIGMTFKSAELVAGGDVQYTVIASGFGRADFEAQFVLHQESGNFVLIGGKVPECPKRHLAGDSADSIAKTFLAHFQIDIASGDAAKIASRFSDGFLFHGCKGDYNKQKVLALLASIPKDSKIRMGFKSAQTVAGENIQYTVVASGFGKDDFDAEFVLHQENGDYVLIGGKVPFCPKRHFYSRFA